MKEMINGCEPYHMVDQPRSSQSTPTKVQDNTRFTQISLTLMPIIFLSLTFTILELRLPLSSAVKIGADEDYELSKATLLNHGFKLYSEIWNDQPPLMTVTIAKLTKTLPHDVGRARLFTVGLSAILLISVYTLISGVNGRLAATIATAMLLGSPGFLELSSSVMQELPALSVAAAALCLLWAGQRTKSFNIVALSGILFGFALQLKLIELSYLPLAGLILLLRHSDWPGNSEERLSQSLSNEWRLRPVLTGGLIFVLSALTCFVLLNYMTRSSLLLQFRQSYSAHFASAQSSEYGSPEEHAFDWWILLKNWETVVPALLGLSLLVSKLRQNANFLVPVIWLGLAFSVFGTHKPWWAYYYVHTALPLCWCAGVGFAELLQRFRKSLPLEKAAARRKTNQAERPDGHIVSSGRLHRLCAATGFTLLIVFSSAWMLSRVLLEEQAVRSAPSLQTCMVLKEIQRFKPFTEFLFSDQPIYSFHADIPMPPHLAILSLKRFWSGNLDNSGLIEDLKATKPGLIVLSSHSKEVPYQALLDRDYKLVYQDSTSRLFAHRSIANKPTL